MLTIDQLVKIDNLANSIITAMHRFIASIGARYDDLLVDAAYRVAEAKAAAIGKAEDNISDLEDDRAELVASGVEARTILERKHREALEALTREILDKEDKITAGLAAAAEELVAATKEYEQTVGAAYEKLGVGVEV